MVCKDSVGAVLILAVCWVSFGSSDGFGLDVHHRYSDTVKDFLDVEGLPAKDSFDYFAAMAHRDHLSKARRLATSPASSPFLTFLVGNQTYQLNSLRSLYYSVVSVGTPAVKFLVALDTAADLFWLPCQSCDNCARSWNGTGTPVKLNLYSPASSSSSSITPCNSTMCDQTRTCALNGTACAYQETYFTNTSSTGILVDDVLALTTDQDPQTQVNAPITLGCGLVQTGKLIDDFAINGLLGLGLDKVSVPSILAKKGSVAADSFSMCFREDGIGRIEFGDQGTPDQKTTPFNVQSLNPSYNVSVTQISVGGNVSIVDFTAIVDSTISFTYLTDPAYSFVTNNFNSRVKEQRYQPATKLIFDYCYSLDATQKSFVTPDMNFTFKGGDQFYVTPIFQFQQQGRYFYCLAIVKTQDINILGQNFLNGYRIVFNREEMLLGWSESNCYDAPGVNKGNTGSDAPPPPSVFGPVAPPRSINRNTTSSPPPPPPHQPFGNGAARFTSTTNGLFMIIVSMLFIILSS